MKMPLVKWEILTVLILLVMIIPAVRAFFIPGYFTTHDGDFHLIRLVHYTREASEGNFPVRVSPIQGEGYSYATFQFFYPLPYLIGSLFHDLGFNFGESIKATAFTTSVLSAVFMYAWLRCHFKRWPALFGALLYVYVPFRFVLMYVTGQLGGMLTLLWVPVLFLSIYQVLVKKRRWVSVGVSIGVAGFILSHIISVLAFLPLLILYTAILWWHNTDEVREKVKLLAILCGAGLLGIGLSAFYLLPARLEAQYVKLGHEVLIHYQDHFPTFKQLVYSPWGYGYSNSGVNDGMSFQVGLAQWAILGIVTLCMVFLLCRRRTIDKYLVLPLGFLLLAGFIIFMMLQISQPIWNLVFPLQYLQFSWRLLAVMMVLVSFLGAWVASIRWGAFVAAGLLILALFANRNHLRTWETLRYDDDHYVKNTELFFGSTDISGEALPVNAPHLPVGPAKSLVNTPIATVSAQPSARHSFSLEVPQEQTVVLNLFAYPSWHVKVDGKYVDVQPSPEGLVSFSLPAGKHDIYVAIERTTLQKISDMLSLLSMPAIVLWIMYWVYADQRLRQPSSRSSKKRKDQTK